MIPKDYSPTTTARQLEDPDLILVMNDRELEDLLENIGLPKRDRPNITAAIARISDGDYDSIWISESNRPYDLSSFYHPLSYYRPRSWTKKRLPIYWKEENPDYSR
jgi:hypothetical protein